MLISVVDVGLREELSQTMASNVILVTIDSLRADCVGSSRNNVPVTPTLDRLGREGTYFTNAIATSSHTKDAFPGIFSSVLPSIQGKHHVDGSYEPLAVAFSKEGYETIGYHSTPMMASYDYAAGFNEFEDLAESSSDSQILERLTRWIPSMFLDPLHRIAKQYGTAGGVDAVSSRASAGEITDTATKYLNRHNEPFCLFVHYMDAHTPYWPPREYIERYTNDLTDNGVRELNDKLLANKDSIHGDPETITDREMEQARELYAASIRYVDDSIDQLLETVSQQGLLEDSLVVVTADHGEEFRDHGGFFHGQKLYEELLRVPLIYQGPNIPSQEINTQISHLGLMPTILDHLGYSVPETATGTSYASIFLGETVEHEFTLAETTIKRLGQDTGRVIACRHNSGLKLIYNEEPPEWTTAEWELYNLVEDRFETTNIFDSEQDQVIRQMEEQITRLKNGVIAQDEVNSEVADRLESLGYRE